MSLKILASITFSVLIVSSTLAFNVNIVDEGYLISLYLKVYKEKITAKSLGVEKLKIVKYELEKIDVTKLDIDQWVNYITTYIDIVNRYKEVSNLGKEFRDSIDSVKIAYDMEMYQKTKGAVYLSSLQATLTKYISADKIDVLVKLLNKEIAPTPDVNTDFVIWEMKIKSWYYDLDKGDAPPVEDNVFVAINKFNYNWQNLYDEYFRTHLGKTKVIWSHYISEDLYNRQMIPNFVARYKDKIHSHVVGGDAFNSFGYDPPYDKFFEQIRQNIVLIYAGDMNATIELIVDYPGSVNADIWLNTLLPYLDIRGLAVWGYNKKTEDQRLTLTMAKERIDRIAPDKYKILIGQFMPLDLERANIVNELDFKGIQFEVNPLE